MRTRLSRRTAHMHTLRVWRPGFESPGLSWTSACAACASRNVAIVISLLVVVFAGCTKSDTAQQQTQSTAQSVVQQDASTKDYYTCPMHPSVRSDRPGACPVCGMALVKKSRQTNMDAGEVASLEAVSLSPTQRVIANVSVIPVKRQDFSRDVTAVGIVSYAEPNYQHITSRFPGRLERLYLSYTGQQVRKGDPVADVYSPEAITAQQEYLLALDSFEQAKQGTQSFLSSAEQLLYQSRQKLLQWGFLEKQIERLKQSRRVEYTVTIYSPVNGTVVKKSVDPQHYVGVGEDMFDVADLSTVWVYLDVYEKEIRFVEKGQRVLIKSDAYPFEMFEGDVVFVDPVVNPETRTIRVRAEFNNPAFKLKPNMFVTGTILIPKMKALVVPSSAIISTGKRTVVWVEVKENVFEPRDVVVGSMREGWSVILNGLDEGERVVETGGFLLDSESALQKPAAFSPHQAHTQSAATVGGSRIEDHTTHAAKR